MKKKILLVTGSINQGGAEFQLLQLSKLLKDKGNVVWVFALTDYSFYKPFITEHQISYRACSNGTNKFLRVLELTSFIRAFKPDIIVSYLRAVSIVAIVARLFSFHKCKLFVSERTSLKIKYYDTFYFNLCRLATGITTNSISKLNYLASDFSFLKRKIHFLPNIVDISKYESAELGWRPSIRKIIYVGRISQEKNLLSLTTALANILKDYSDIEVHYYGASKSADYLAAINNIIAVENVADSFFYHGAVSNLSEVYASADLLCLVSYYEGFSNVISEAIASALPVVCSNIDENTVLVKDNVNGRLADPFSVENIESCIRDIIQLTPEELHIVKSASKEIANELFNSENIYTNYANILQLNA